MSPFNRLMLGSNIHSLLCLLQNEWPHWEDEDLADKVHEAQQIIFQVQEEQLKRNLQREQEGKGKA